MSMFSNLYNTISGNNSTSIGGNVPLNTTAGVPAAGGNAAWNALRAPSAGADSFSQQYMPKMGISGSLPNMPGIPGPNSMQAPAMPQMAGGPPQASNLGFRPAPTPPTPVANPQNINPQSMGPQVPGAPAVPLPQPGILNPALQRRGLLQQ
jgi:hypothetical protein